MKIIVSIDDTDNETSLGTGEIAMMIAEGIYNKGWGQPGKITRHQLLLHPDIPYTSHNSSMCFIALIQDERYEELVHYCGQLLKKESAPEADPGLCIVDMNRISDSRDLVDFGLKAKNVILSKQNAYDLAEALGIHLSEHGGTGQGVIGALAGAGLRVTGNDGRFKGLYHFSGDIPLSVKEICALTGLQVVQTASGEKLKEHELVLSGEKVKTVLLNHQETLLVEKLDPPAFGAVWKNCSLKNLRTY